MSALPNDPYEASTPTDVEVIGVDPADLDEAALLQLSRHGDVEAFAELFRRHYAVAVRIAARTSRALDPEEVAAEAFAKVWSALSRGKGPERLFRPYLATVIRNIAINQQRSITEVATDPALLPESVREGDDTATAIAEGQSVCAAFATLPERWRNALWATEVEGVPVAEFARTIGVSPNAAAALTLRAREGLKAAWLQGHVDRLSAAPECQWVLGHLGAYERHRLPAGQRRRAEAHLADCADCRRTRDRIGFIGRALKVSVLFAGTGASVLAIKAAFGSVGTAGAVLALKPATGLIGAGAGPLAQLAGRTAELAGSIRTAVQTARRAVAGHAPGLTGAVAGAVTLTVVAVAAAAATSSTSGELRAEQALVAPVAAPTTSVPTVAPPTTSPTPTTRRPDPTPKADKKPKAPQTSTAPGKSSGHSTKKTHSGGRSGQPAPGKPDPDSPTPRPTQPIPTPTPIRLDPPDKVPPPITVPVPDEQRPRDQRPSVARHRERSQARPSRRKPLVTEVHRSRQAGEQATNRGRPSSQGEPQPLS